MKIISALKKLSGNQKKFQKKSKKAFKCYFKMNIRDALED